MKFIKNHFPVLISLLFFWFLIFVLFNLSIKQTGGFFTYSLDDGYIHMSLAKHFIEFKTIGIVDGVFAFCTSSLLWTTFLIISFKIFGINTFIPFVTNIILSSVLIIVSYSIINKKIKNSIVTLIVLLLLIFGTPLHAMVFNGLEHVLHILLTILFIYYSSEYITDKKKFTEFSSPLYRLMLLSLLLAAARYEGLFLVLVVSVFILIRKKVLGSILIFLAGILPMTLAGIYAISEGWQFLPSSILLKGNFPIESFSKIIKFFFYSFYPNLAETGSLVILVTLLMIFFVLIYSKVRRINYKSITILLIVLLMTALHLQFASTGWFYRYEAYLIYTGILFLSVSISEISTLYKEKFHYFKDRKIRYGFVFILIIALSPIINRGLNAVNKIPLASRNIYEQHIINSRFLSNYLKSEYVAMNDIGAASLYSHAKIVDLWGLGDKNFFYSKLSGNYNAAAINNILTNDSVKTAIIYENWFEGDVNFHKKWLKCGSWKIQNNFICGIDEISFFAKDSMTYLKLKADLSAFSKRLPETVIQKGIYLQKQEK